MQYVFRFKPRFSLKDQTFFAKRLSFLVRAGVPLLDGLQLIRAQTKSKAQAALLDAVIGDVENGQFLSTGLARHAGLLGGLAIGLIRVGEHGGILPQNLAYLADELHKKSLLKRKIAGALIYPILITLATFGLSAMLTAFIFPKLMPIFTSLHVELPLTTRMLIAVSSYLRAWGLLTLVGIIAICIALAAVVRRSERARTLRDRTLLRLPVIGSIVRSYNLANFCRTLGLLLGSGMALTESLGVAADTTGNVVYRDAARVCAAGVEEGGSLAQGLARTSAAYPDLLVNMVAIGERTGNLAQTFTYLSELYEGEVDEQAKNLSAAIEPALMIVMGLLVGLIAVSIIMPIYDISQHLQPK